MVMLTTTCSTSLSAHSSSLPLFSFPLQQLLLLPAEVRRQRGSPSCGGCRRSAGRRRGLGDPAGHEERCNARWH